VWVWLENEDYTSVVGSADAPYETSLALACGLGTADNRVATIVVPPSVVSGTVSAEAFTHCSLSRTTEDLLGLPLLGAAVSAASMVAPSDLG
jgi:hypothetical protein